MTITLLAPDGVSVTAQQERQARAAQYGGGSGRQLGLRSGFRIGTPSNILTASSTTWTLGPCAIAIDPGAAVYQGGYGWSSDANITGTMRPANSTYSRKDIVYIQLNDSSSGDGSGAINANPVYAYGAEDGTNAAPALPVRSFLLGTISVPVAGGGSPTVVRNPAVYVAAGADLPVSSQAERDALSKYDGLSVQRLDVSGRPTERWDGVDWRRHNSAVTYANTQFIGSGMNSDNFTSGTSRRVEQDGTFVGTTDAQGYLLIGYPAVFPNGVIRILVGNGDASVNRKAKMDVATSPFTNDLTKFYVSVVDSSTGNPIANTTVRCNWSAVGW